MRINKYVALATGLSRRSADKAMAEGRVSVNSQVVPLGYEVKANEVIKLDGKVIELRKKITVLLNKPVGYVCSRNGQCSPTIYDLLPAELTNLKPVGRLDKDSSGLLLLTNDGELAQKLTHPSYNKEKKYQVVLDKSLKPEDKHKIEGGIKLKDGLSSLKLSGQGTKWTVTIHEGRNRQIRRTFEALEYRVVKLNRTDFGQYSIHNIGIANYTIL